MRIERCPGGGLPESVVAWDVNTPIPALSSSFATTRPPAGGRVSSRDQPATAAAARDERLVLAAATLDGATMYSMNGTEPGVLDPCVTVTWPVEPTKTIVTLPPSMAHSAENWKGLPQMFPSGSIQSTVN